MLFQLHDYELDIKGNVLESLFEELLNSNWKDQCEGSKESPN